MNVNNQPLGIFWKAPFRANVNSALNRGENRLEIKATSLWVNRMIGDQQPGVIQKYTYTTVLFYLANSPLLPSGLLGPVHVVKLNTP